jgi:hypothetical protein
MKRAAKQVGLQYATVRRMIAENKQKQDHVKSRNVTKRRCKKVVTAAPVTYVRIIATNRQPTLDMMYQKLCEAAQVCTREMWKHNIRYGTKIECELSALLP